MRISIVASVFSIAVLLTISAEFPSSDHNGVKPVSDSDVRFLLSSLVSRPEKRQLCPGGYFYNPVAGYCMPSLAIIKARRRY